jgi:molybdopterin/thiamine biosynthesis adenylyltransferase
MDPIKQDEILEKIKPVYVFFPWNKILLKMLPENEFIKVRTSRNRYKITQEEQDILKEKRVGVVGLSVGRVVATTLALERSCGELRLADFDTLDLSNLNRLKAPLQDLGLLKTVSTEREIYGFDPFFKVISFDEGITEANLDAFFEEGDKLDLLIDECDNIEVKIKLRQKAKLMGIPVIMDTSDRGRLDIERYDLDPSLPIFNGKLEGIDLPENGEYSNETRQAIFNAIVPSTSLSKRAIESIQEIGKSISTWPQLASAVTMGGGAAANIARNILLGNEFPSGIFMLDMENLEAFEERG